MAERSILLGALLAAGCDRPGGIRPSELPGLGSELTNVNDCSSWYLDALNAEETAELTFAPAVSSFTQSESDEESGFYTLDEDSDLTLTLGSCLFDALACGDDVVECYPQLDRTYEVVSGRVEESIDRGAAYEDPAEETEYGGGSGCASGWAQDLAVALRFASVKMQSSDHSFTFDDFTIELDKTECVEAPDTGG